MRVLMVALLVMAAAACTSTPDAASTTTPTPSPTTTTTSIVAAEELGLPWWNDRVFYEVFVRSFADSDGDGDGDLNGLIERLDYLNDGDPETTDDLGVTGIWLMPVFESPSYHGYDVVDYMRIESDYGSDNDFFRLVEAAHDRGIAVIVDLVMNHSSRQHPWFGEADDATSAKRDWYIWTQDQPTWLGPWGQTVWHERSGEFYYGLFWEGMPDLNLTNSDVTAEMHDIARFWLDDVGVDGFRLDAARHYIEDGEVQEDTAATMAWLAEFTSAMHELDDDSVIIGEVWADTETVAEYIPNSLDAAFDFGLADAFATSMARWEAGAVSQALEQSLRSFPEGRFAPFLTNHDQDRIMSQLGGNWDRAELAAVWLLTLPGSPFVYYGEEVGLEGTKPDERIRTPMPWTDDSIRVGFTEGIPWEPPDLGFHDANVATQTNNPDSLLSTYRTLIQYRNRSNVLRLGTTTVLTSVPTEVYASLRSYGNTHVLTVLNFSGREVAVDPLQLQWIGESGTATTIHGDTPDRVIDDMMNYTPASVMPPFSSYVIELSTDT